MCGVSHIVWTVVEENVRLSSWILRLPTHTYAGTISFSWLLLVLKLTQVKYILWPIFHAQGSETIEAIFVKFEDMEQLASSYRGLINLQYLRFLHVSTNHACLINNSDGSRNILPSDNMQSGVSTLPNLRWLSWHHLKVELLMLVRLSLRNLVILDLSETDVDENWLGWQKLKVFYTRCYSFHLISDICMFMLMIVCGSCSVL